MAPIRTRSQAAGGAGGGGIGKKVHRKARNQRDPGDSWELLERHGLNGYDNNAHTDPEHDESLEQPEPLDVDEVIDPLRTMAERVGREAETFAETLDKFFTDLPTVSSRFDAAHDLVLQFKKVATETVEELKKHHERETREQLRREWSEQAAISVASTALQPFTSATSIKTHTSRKAEQIQQLRQWQQEADIWELFRLMLELHPFEADAHAMRAEKEEKLAKLGLPHRYTSEGDLWERFLMEDNLARERSMVKTWLEQTADHQVSDVPSIVEELEAKAGRGKGLWSSGWMHTRERIKGEKRLRSWPDSSESSLPQIRRSDNNELIATTLDPDAPCRQQRTLEKPDAYFERAIWVACWEMLRRGKPLHEICDWCEERKEGWRALIMGGALDLTESTTSNAAWRHLCLQASQSASATDYEAAVLGAIGGNVKAMEKVSHTIDDHLYAYYSAALTRQFDHYLLSACPDIALPNQWRRSGADEMALDPERAQHAIAELIFRLRKNASTSSESAQPMKIIQSFLLADEVGSLIHTVGAAIAEAAALQGPEDMIYLRDRQPPETGRPRGEIEVALNMQTLRVATHMAIIHRILSPDYLEGDELLEDENVLVSYIQALRKAGKLLLIPLYASKLQRPRYIIVLGRVLQDITEPREQKAILHLLEDADMDVLSILQEQLAWILDTSVDSQYATTPLPIVEHTAETKLHPGQRIKVDFLPDMVVKTDEAVVSALKWFQLLPGQWEITFKTLTIALRRSLVTGNFACARLIVQNFPFAEVSLNKSYETIGKAVNVMDDSSFDPDTAEEGLRIDVMKRQSRTYYELEQLVIAIEAIFAWRTEEHKYVEKAVKPAGIPSTLKKGKARVTEAMEPLIHGILQNPIDEEEEADLMHIRHTYLPEIIIAYNIVLHAAGNLITREALLESMDLSVAIANGTDGVADGEEDRNNGLAECFIKAGRMRELMSSFALTSKLMLVLKAEGRPWRPKKDRVGRDLGIWELNEANLEAT